jgi:tRNA splicing ligase
VIDLLQSRLMLAAGSLKNRVRVLSDLKKMIPLIPEIPFEDVRLRRAFENLRQ